MEDDFHVGIMLGLKRDFIIEHLNKTDGLPKVGTRRVIKKKRFWEAQEEEIKMETLIKNNKSKFI